MSSCAWSRVRFPAVGYVTINYSNEVRMKNQNDGNILASKVTRGPMLRQDRFILFAAIVLFLEMIRPFCFHSACDWPRQVFGMRHE